MIHRVCTHSIPNLFVYLTAKSNNDLKIAIYTILFHMCFCIIYIGDVLMLASTASLHWKWSWMWETTLVRLFCTLIRLHRMKTGQHESYIRTHLLWISSEPFERKRQYFFSQRQGNMCVVSFTSVYLEFLFMYWNKWFFLYLGFNAKSHCFIREENRETLEHMTLAWWRLFLFVFLIVLYAMSTYTAN